MQRLEPSTSTMMTRTTVHRQYNGKALGFFVLNNLVPIVLHIRIPGPRHYNAVLVFGKKTRKYNPYADFGLMTKECKTVFLFNVKHYVRCYLPAVLGSDGNPTIPYTYNLCQFCGASVEDDGGKLLQQISSRSYRADKYIWRTGQVLQSSTGEAVTFTPPSGAR